jgi:thiamine-phosphate pyrophosphorylase
MRPRQTVPRQWLVIAEERDAIGAVLRLPRRSGVLLLTALPRREMLRLRHIARQRGLAIVEEQPGSAARVHNVRELRRALLQRTPVILLSPVFPTRTHPEWKPLPRMQAAAIARLGARRLLALGGMDARKVARVERFGFRGWAGISAFRT